jgi:hypothetical protein
VPIRLRDLARVAQKEFGCQLERPATGSHWKVRTPAGKVYPLPCHNGEKTELGDQYLKGLCKLLGVSPEDFKKKL